LRFAQGTLSKIIKYNERVSTFEFELKSGVAHLKAMCVKEGIVTIDDHLVRAAICDNWKLPIVNIDVVVNRAIRDVPLQTV
jgi:hypothetical protein